QKLSDAGKYDDALAMYAVAMERLKNAVAIGRGDANAYYEQCHLQSQMLRSLHSKRRLMADDRAAATAPCDVATRIDPQFAAAFVERGEIDTMIAEDHVRFGEDPGAFIADSVASLQRAIAIDPNDAAAIGALGRSELI